MCVVAVARTFCFGGYVRVAVAGVGVALVPVLLSLAASNINGGQGFGAATSVAWFLEFCSWLGFSFLVVLCTRSRQQQLRGSCGVVAMLRC